MYADKDVVYIISFNYRVLLFNLPSAYNLSKYLAEFIGKLLYSIHFFFK